MIEVPRRRSWPLRSRSLGTLLVGSARLLIAVFVFRQAASAQEPAPLHERIDQLIAESTSGIAAPVVGDAEFLRRASLDLIGIPPSVEEVRAFLADENPSKRAAAIDRLLGHPRYARHMSEVFDVMLMERRGYQYVTEAEWREYLTKAFRENRPLNQLAKELLDANGAEPNPRAAVRFYLDRGADPNLLTRDVGRIFFGRDMQCAQCHDHPTILDYHQADYYGLLAFFQSGGLYTAPAPDGKVYYSESPGSNPIFESVFISGKHTTGPKLLGLTEVEEPALYPDEQYEVKPTSGARPVLKFSRRAKLAELATNGTNRAFNENFANRLWAHMMGRGLVEPVDLHHSANPPSNPALMKLLGEELAGGGFDVKQFLRSLALTQTYQRSIDPPPNPSTYAELAASVSGEIEKRVTELKAAAEEAEKKYQAAMDEFGTTEEAAMPVVTELGQATAAATQAATKLDESQAQLSATRAQVAAKTAVSQTLSDAVAKAQEVTKALPQDQELIQAAQKFAERQQQVAVEVGTLTKDVEAKTAVVTESQSAVATTRQGIDAVRTKFAPLSEALKQKRQFLTTARELLWDRETVQSSYEERLSSVKQLAQLKPLEEQISTAPTRIGAAETALADARKAVEGQQAGVAAADEARRSADEALKQAAAVTAAAKTQCDACNQRMVVVNEALAKTRAAQELIPEDANLQQAVAALVVRLESLKIEAEIPKTKLAEATAAEQAAAAQLNSTTEAHNAAIAAMASDQQQVAQAEQQLAALRAELEAHSSELSKARDAVDQHLAKTFAVQPLKPLTPEQMCWSILQVTGVYDRYVIQELAEMDKAAPMAEEDKKDSAKVAARDQELQQRVYDKLRPNVAAFVSMYAPAAGQPQDDFFASASQALFAANGGTFTGWAAPAGANVTERVIQQQDPKAAAEDLYLAVLSRMPSDAEVAEVTGYLASRPQDKPACVQELVWGLLTSVEFRFNH